MATVIFEVTPKVLIYKDNENNNEDKTFRVEITVMDTEMEDPLYYIKGVTFSLGNGHILEPNIYQKYITGNFKAVFDVKYSDLNWKGYSLGSKLYYCVSLYRGPQDSIIEGDWMVETQDYLEDSYIIYSTDPIKEIKLYSEGLTDTNLKNYYNFNQLYSNIPYNLSYIDSLDEEHTSFDTDNGFEFSEIVTPTLKYYSIENDSRGELKGVFSLNEYDYNFKDLTFLNSEIKNYILVLTLDFIEALGIEQIEKEYPIIVYPYQRNELNLTYERQKKYKEEWYSLPFGETILYKINFKDINPNIPFYFNDLSIVLLPYSSESQIKPIDLLPSEELENLENLENFNLELNIRDEINELSPENFYYFHLCVRDGISEYITTYKITPYFNREMTLEKGAILIGTGIQEEGLNYIVNSYGTQKKHDFSNQPFCLINNAHISDFKKFVSFNRTNYFSKWGEFDLWDESTEMEGQPGDICGKLNYRISMDGTVHLKGYLTIAGNKTSWSLATGLPFLLLPEEDKDFFTPIINSSELLAHFRLTLNGNFILKGIRKGAANNTDTTKVYINFDFSYNVPYLWKKNIDEYSFNSENINFYQNLEDFPNQKIIAGYSYETPRFFPSSEQKNHKFESIFSYESWRTSTSDLNPYLIFSPQGKIINSKYENFFSISDIELNFYYNKNPLEMLKTISLKDGEWDLDNNEFIESGLIQTFFITEDLVKSPIIEPPPGEEENWYFNYVIKLPAKTNFYNLKIEFELQENITNLDLRGIDFNNIQKIYKPSKNHYEPATKNYFGLSSMEETINNYAISSNWEIN